MTTENDLSTSTGETRLYRLFIPGAYQAGTAVPLVLNLHGLNSNPVRPDDVTMLGQGTGRDVQRGLSGRHQRRLGFRVTPGSPDEVFLSELIVALQGAYAIDAHVST